MPRSLFCALSGLNKLREVHFEFPLNLISKWTMAFLTGPIMTRTQILVHGWGLRTIISVLFCGGGYLLTISRLYLSGCWNGRSPDTDISQSKWKWWSKSKFISTLLNKFYGHLLVVFIWHWTIFQPGSRKFVCLDCGVPFTLKHLLKLHRNLEA